MISDHLPDIKGLIIDMDGVLWRDSQPIGDLPSIFKQIADDGIKFIFATNNSTRTVSEYLEKLQGFGVTLESWQVITVAMATGIYLREIYPDGCRIYVVGQPSLKQTLMTYGHFVVDETSQDVQVVVGSVDYALSYEKLKHASLLIQSGCKFIGTNPDVTLPTPEGLVPGSGTVIGALEIASNTKATLIGKPEPLLYQMALKQLNLYPEETLAIGDRLETDIAGAQAAGVHTALVLSGASTLSQARMYNNPPEIITQDLTELIF
jgi:4-nitrophenyl phosphatase